MREYAFQDDGACRSLKEANDALNKAKKATPQNIHDLFQSNIRAHKSLNPENQMIIQYVWTWYLR